MENDSALPGRLLLKMGPCVTFCVPCKDAGDKTSPKVFYPVKKVSPLKNEYVYFWSRSESQVTHYFSFFALAVRRLSTVSFFNVVTIASEVPDMIVPFFMQ